MFKRSSSYLEVELKASITSHVLSHDKVSSFPYKMHVIMFAWDLTLVVMQYLEYLKFLQYLLGVEHEGGRNANGRRSILDVTSGIKINV